MVIKTARRGRNAGNQFYSCSRYPGCKGTKSVSTISKSYIDDESSTKMDSKTRNLFEKLVKYYRECISIENLSDITFRKSGETYDFIQCPSDIEWLSSEKETFLLKNEAIANFGSRSRWKRRQSYYYAYPIYVQKYKRRDTSTEDAVIKPLMIFPVEVDKDSESIKINRADFYRPQVNASVLTSSGFYARPEVKKVFIQKMLELWKEEDNNESNFKKVINELISEFGDIEYLKNNQIYSSEINFDEVETGFYSTGILFVTQGSNYTYGVEEELQNIEDGLKDDVSRMPVIEAILNRAKRTENKKDSDIIEIIPLNDEQRNAVASAFSNDLSIITGPPGTGKSQVVINIIANAVAKGESVLFGSKNHQAVDVVLQRIYDVQSEPIVLKFGQNARESVFAEKLLAAVDKTLTLDSDVIDKKISELSDKLASIFKRETKIWPEINKCYETRNKVNKFEKELDRINSNFPDMFKDFLDNAQVFIVNTARKKKLAKLLEIATVKRFDLINFILGIFGSTINKRLSAIIMKILSDFGFTNEINKYFHSDIDNIDEIIIKAELLSAIIEYNYILKRSLDLQKTTDSSTEKIQNLKNELLQLRKQKCELSSAYVDCISTKRLMRLSSSDRSKISDYVATIKRIEQDQVGGEIVESLRKEKKDLFSSVVSAFPALAVTNLSVRHVVPMNIGIVDLVVIDEASQCDIASALPMLIRAKRAVIIGDDKQLIHVSNISKVSDQQLQGKHGLKSASLQRFLYSTYSLFDLCKTTVGNSGNYIMLQDHYRSRKEIIDFSNKYFYSNSLKVRTDYRQLKQSGTVEGIIWYDVQGEVVRPSTGSVYNLAEAKKVIAILEEIIPQALSDNASIGIVTPFRAQENKIKDMLLKTIDMDCIERLDIKIDTAHGYQGDERDIIIFSTVLSKGMQEKTKRFLINTQNLFNVAITRPRSQLIIVGDRKACANSKVEHLENFVNYVKGLKNRKNIKEKRHEVVFDSIWEEIFYKKLKEQGINTIPQYAMHQYKIDLAIEENDPPIAIEVDGEAYHREITGERCVSDIKRDIRLNLMGWNVKRFWVYELKYDMNKCVKEIKELVNNENN